MKNAQSKCCLPLNWVTLAVGPQGCHLCRYLRREAVKKAEKFHQLGKNLESPEVALQTSSLIHLLIALTQILSRFKVILNECQLFFFFFLTCTYLIEEW